jgi:hypothetical protein
MRRFDPFTQITLLKEVIGAVIALIGAILTWIKLRKAPSWPTAQGTVMSTRSGRRESGRGWACHFTYSYAANNEYYSGTHSIKARNEKQADELAASWKGRSIAVRYSPGDHSVSALLRDDQIGGFGN